eukprot:scaffold11986_cov175-Alexandrium_tamarense.AAC.2
MHPPPSSLLFTLLIVLLIFITSSPTTSASSPSSSSSSQFRSDPYEILQIPETATQKEIKQAYRSLCLKHHPDKQDGSDDLKFKEVQHAYSLVGTDETRRSYNLRRRLNAYSSGASSSTANSMWADTRGSTVHCTFGENGVSFQVRRRNYASSSTYNPFFGMSDMRSAQFAPRRSGFGDVASTKRAHYIQEVSVPLEVLYAGGVTDFTLNTSVIDRYKAAYRGGTLTPILLQATLTIVMTWLRSQKVNWWLSLFLFTSIVHLNIPSPPTKTVYSTTIKRGWKGGTKVKYNIVEERCVADVTFVLKEGKHKTFTRSGNDLFCNVKVSPRRLRRECTLYIDSLSPSEQPIKVKIRKGEVKKDGHIITIKGRGWRKGNNADNSDECGDLHVKVHFKGD